MISISPDWNDQNLSYVAVGFEPIDVIEGLAEQLQRSYRL